MLHLTNVTLLVLIYSREFDGRYEKLHEMLKQQKNILTFNCVTSKLDILLCKKKWMARQNLHLNNVKKLLIRCKTKQCIFNKYTNITATKQWTIAKVIYFLLEIEIKIIITFKC